MEFFEIDRNLANNNTDFKEFSIYALNLILKKKPIDLPTGLRIQIQNLAVKKLGLRDLFQLKDRFDGQAYMDNLMIKIFSLYIVSKTIDINSTNFDDLESIINDDFTRVEFENKYYRIIPFYFGTLPIVYPTITDPIIFCAIKNDFKSGICCGILNNFQFTNETIFLPRYRVTSVEAKKFIGFDKLINVTHK